MSKTLWFFLLVAVAGRSMAQSPGSTLEIHGFAAEGVLYSSYNNYLEPHTSDGEPSWTEVVVSVTDRPTAKLRVGAQLHYYRLGTLGGETPTIDWASGDYRFNDYIGVRAGKVKTALGLWNQTQDIDAVYLWSLLPQSTYPIDIRDLYLAHIGGEVYGSAALGERGGRLRYRFFGGSNALGTGSHGVDSLANATGVHFTSPLNGPLYGMDVRWQTPYKPLTIGASALKVHTSTSAAGGDLSFRLADPIFYAQLDRGRLYVAGEYRHQTVHVNFHVGPDARGMASGEHQSYVMVAYHATSRLQVGTYYSMEVAPSAEPSYQESHSKDFVLSSRYDFNANFYAKAEEHFLHGTLAQFSPDDNLAALHSRTYLTIAKLGFTF